MTDDTKQDAALEARIAELVRLGHSREAAEEIAAFEVDGPDVVPVASALESA